MTMVKQRFIHMTARKLRLVADIVRGKEANQAMAQLQVMPKAAAQPILQALKSALSAAKQKQQDGPFTIHTIYVDEGPAMKRRILRSRGRASRMEHRMSHITLHLQPAKPSIPTKTAKETK